MLWSKTFISTYKETPQDAEIASHALMVRAGLMLKLSSGLYIYLPLCLRVFEKVNRIIREELTRDGAVEVLMPALQPQEIWEKSGRWDKMGELMMKVSDREQRTFVLGPTHEEIITYLASRKITSYKELPVNFFQIQTKFRDEIRPRFGLMRAREFIMKDGYSFNLDEKDLDKSYWEMYHCYERIFDRCGLKAVPVEADTGVMGGNESHEFMVLASAGEDKIVTCPDCGYAANMEQAARNLPESEALDCEAGIEKVHTPEFRKVEDLERFFNLKADRFIKTLVYKAGEELVVVLVRGDLDVQESKLRSYLKTAELELADDASVEAVTKAPVGFAGPVGLDGARVIADKSVVAMTGAITGANEKDFHFTNVNVGRDFEIVETADIATVLPGDICTKCGSALDVKDGIEVGQVFKLGTKYSEPLGATYIDSNGKPKPMVMGCYGIGVSRTVAAIVESCSDEKGIIWPMSVAPYQIVVLPLKLKSQEVVDCATDVYEKLKNAGYDVILDDRDVRPGFKFKDADLIGFPIQVAVGEKGLAEGKLEVTPRKTGVKEFIPVESIVEAVGKIAAEL